MADNKMPLVDRNKGLELSFGSEELYDSIIEAYIEEVDSNIEGLNKFLAEKNWREYRVIAHAIKSNSKQIGAEALFEEAFKMEMAAKDENETEINECHEDFLLHYNQVAEFIKNGFNFEDVHLEAMDYDKSLRNDIAGILSRTYLKVLRINLKTKTHEDILVYIQEMDTSSGYSENIDEWFHAFADAGKVHPDDLYEYKAQTDLDSLRNHFKYSDDDLMVFYRRKVSSDFHWVHMTMRKSVDYTPENPIIILYIRDIEREPGENIEKQIRIINTLSDIYFCVYFVDLATNSTERIKSVDYLDKLFDNISDANEVLNRVEKYLVADDYKESMHEFNNIRKWKARLLDKNDISMEFLGNNIGWVRANVIVSERDKEGVPTEVLFAVQEINDQKAREERARKDIMDALSYANEASKAKSAFLANMSHDIRTPMNAIVGYTNLALAHIEETERVNSYVENIAAAGRHLMELINSILDMSRIESGKVQIEPIKCDLGELMTELKIIVNSHSELKNINFVVDISELKHKYVMCDSLKMNQIFFNLIGNSIKFTDPGGLIYVSVKEGYVRNGSAIYKFTVRDNGCGMNQEFLTHIFEPFEREQSATESGIQGTGLGLSIVKNLVELMGGSISVESKLGLGTEFKMQIPFEIVEEYDTENGNVEKSHEESVDNQDIQIEGMRILLVEDNAINIKLAHAILEENGIILEEAHNGKEAVEIYSEKEAGYYDLILMDVQMPIMNGYEATKAIRAMSDGDKASIPIIAMTANAFEEDKKEALRAGMDAHVSKPIDVDVLFNTIKKVKGYIVLEG